MSFKERFFHFFSDKYRLVFLSFLLLCCGLGIAYGCTYISATFANNIYMDQIRYYSDYTDKILQGTLSFSDVFNVYAGHIGVGTMLLLIFDVKVLGVNPSFWGYITPFALAGIASLLSCFLYRRKAGKLSLVVSLLFTAACFFLVFSVQQWEILTFSWGLIIHLGNLFFLVSFILFSKLLSQEVFSVKTTVAALIVSGLNILLFGGGYDFPFLLALLLVFAFYFVFRLASKQSFSKWKVIPAGVVAVYFIILLIAARNSVGGSGGGIVEILQLFVQGQTVVLFDRGKEPGISFAAGLAWGIALILFYLGAVVLYFFRKGFSKSYLPLFLLAFSQLSVLAISIARSGGGDLVYSAASRYYATYVLGFIAACSIYLSEIEGLICRFLQKQRKPISAYVGSAAGVFFQVLLIACCALSTKQEWGIAPYRKEIADQQLSISLFWEKMDPQGLELLYQEKYENIQGCFTALKENNLYVFRDGLPGTSDSLKTTTKVYGFYAEPDFLWVSGSFLFLIRASGDQTMPLSFSNPDTFPDNEVQVKVDDQTVSTLPVASGSQAQDRIQLTAGVHVVEISAVTSTIPKEHSESQDGRSLSVILNYFTLE